MPTSMTVRLIRRRSVGESPAVVLVVAKPDALTAATAISTISITESSLAGSTRLVSFQLGAVVGRLAGLKLLKIGCLHNKVWIICAFILTGVTKSLSVY